MDLFMPAERVLYDRAYYLSDEAVDDYNEYIADRDGVNVDVVSSLDFFMNEVWKEIDYAIDNDLSDEISCFDRMLRDLKCGGDPEHPTEISVVAKGTVERWDEPSRGLVVADSLLSLVQGTGSADALKDCQIDRLVDTNGEFHIEASHHDGSANLGSISTMATSRNLRRSSSSRRRSKAARALRRWPPQQRPPRGIALRVPITASTVFSVIGVRYNRCGR